MIGHRFLGATLLLTGRHRGRQERISIKAIALYDPAEHRPLATRFGEDPRVAILFFRSYALWLLGYPEAALADIDQALKDAREIGQAVSLICALAGSFFIVDSLLRKLHDSKCASR